MIKEFEEKMVYDGLIECINNFIEEEKNILKLKNEGYFHLRLYNKLKEYFRKNISIEIVLEYYVLNYDLDNYDIKDIIKNYNVEDENAVIFGSSKIDIVIIFNNKHYLIELKNSIYYGQEWVGGLINMQL